jgi:hypothetical protein
MGHPQPQTPIQTDNTLVEGVTNKKIQPKCTKAMDMRFHWLQDRESQDQLNIHWWPGKTNLADYFTKHHPPNHHTNVRAEFLTKVQYLAEARQKQLVNRQTTTPQTQIAKLQGCVSLPKKSTYVQKPTYASLANFSKEKFKSPRGRLVFSDKANLEITHKCVISYSLSHLDCHCWAASNLTSFYC